MDSAIADYDETIAIDPANASYYRERGEIKSACKEYLFGMVKDLSETQKRHFQSTLEYFNREIELNPEYVQAYESRKAFFSSFEQYDKWLEDINKLIELQPEKSKYYLERASYYLRINKKAAAMADW